MNDNPLDSELSLREYYDECQRHNWFYKMASGKDYTNGHEAERRLNGLALNNPARLEILVGFKAWRESSIPMLGGTGETLKPERPE